MKITVENAGFGYKKDVPVIKNMNFSAQSGELVAILGPNGAGKTTLLKCMMGFLKWNEGRSMLDGEDMLKIPQRKLWQKVAYVPQAKGAFASFSVEEMILLGRTNRIGVFSAPGEDDRKQVKRLAEMLSITYLLDKKCTEISGGELQMVLIARALAAEPQLLILDEPESNLDFRNQLIVLNAMSELTAKGMCCIFNTHYPTHALMRATKSLILHKGGESVFGNTPDVVTEANIRKAFGVDAVIGEIETGGNVFKSIMPLSISVGGQNEASSVDESRSDIAVLSVIFRDFDTGEIINNVLHEYSSLIIGRMGMPYKKEGLFIINATLDGEVKDINTLAHRLNILPGVSVKATFASNIQK